MRTLASAKQLAETHIDLQHRGSWEQRAKCTTLHPSRIGRQGSSLSTMSFEDVLSPVHISLISHAPLKSKIYFRPRTLHWKKTPRRRVFAVIVYIEIIMPISPSVY